MVVFFGGALALHVGQPEPAGEDHPVVLDDRDRHARDVQFLPPLLQSFRESLDPRV